MGKRRILPVKNKAVLEILNLIKNNEKDRTHSIRETFGFLQFRLQMFYFLTLPSPIAFFAFATVLFATTEAFSAPSSKISSSCVESISSA